MKYLVLLSLLMSCCKTNNLNPVSGNWVIQSFVIKGKECKYALISNGVSFYKNNSFYWSGTLEDTNKLGYYSYLNKDTAIEVKTNTGGMFNGKFKLKVLEYDDLENIYLIQLTDSLRRITLAKLGPRNK